MRGKFLKGDKARYNQKNGKQFLKEQAHAVSTRQEFSRKIKAFREEGMKIVYVDETLINANHVAPGEWTENGLISGTNSIQPNPQEAETIDCFKCHGNNDDEMNIENFMEWFTHDFLPSQEEPSVIVLGNAQYHNAITEESKSPTSNNRKGEIIEWLVQRNIQFLPRHTKAELLDIVRLYKPEPVYITDIAAFEHGHQCLRVPVHHLYSELNPIKTAQAQKKRCVDQKNTSVKLPKQLSLEAKDKATDCLESPGNHTDMGQQQFWITDNLDVQEEEVSAAMNICVDESFTEEDDRSDSEEEQEECSTGNHGDDLLCTIQEDDDGLCAVCNSQFPRSGNNAVVEWLYCDACDQWLHLECSGEVAVPDVDNYMCKRCSVDPGYSANFPSNPKVRVLTKRNI